MVFQWKPGALIKADAQIAGEVLTRIEQTKGLTPKNLLDESRPEDAPLHNEFEWDDSMAAEKYREDQARYIIRHIAIAPERADSQPVRAFFNITSTERQYKSLEVIMNSPSEREQLVRTAFKELDAFRTKYDSLSNYLGIVFRAIDTAKTSEAQRLA